MVVEIAADDDGARLAPNTAENRSGLLVAKLAHPYRMGDIGEPFRRIVIEGQKVDAHDAHLAFADHDRGFEHVPAFVRELRGEGLEFGGDEGPLGEDELSARGEGMVLRQKSDEADRWIVGRTAEAGPRRPSEGRHEEDLGSGLHQQPADGATIVGPGTGVGGDSEGDGGGANPG